MIGKVGTEEMTETVSFTFNAMYFFCGGGAAESTNQLLDSYIIVCRHNALKYFQF